MADYSNVYPYSVVPQYRELEIGQPSVSCLKCTPDDSLQAILFDKDMLAVIKGYEWKSKI